MVRLNQRVRHCAWRWEGTLVDFPFDFISISFVTVQWDNRKEPSQEWLPSLILIEEEEFDWDE